MIKVGDASAVMRPRFQLRIRQSPGGDSATPVHVPWYVKFFLAYLAGITIIGKGPTYLGVPPIYWGEVTLLTGLLLIVPQIKQTRFLEQTRVVTFAILAFLALGSVRTAVSIPRWGLDAIRDAAMWYYTLFFFIGLGLASRKALADRVWYLLRGFWLWSLIWNTVDHLTHYKLSQSGINLFFNGAHEAGQNLALGSLLVLCTTVLRHRPVLRSILLPVAVVGLGLVAASDGRGMRVGIALGALVVMLLSLAPTEMPHFTTRLLKFAVVGVPVLALIVAAAPDRFVKVTNLDRFAEADPSNPEGTANWRMMWWKRLYEEVMERNPAFGLGFGESLTVYHPARASLDVNLRSPHNINMTVFTRMGLVGITLWATILLTGIGSLFYRVWQGSAEGEAYTGERRDELTFWLCMLVCTIVNSSFSVLMEGPVLGIWFWFALGFASARSLSSGVEYRPRILTRAQRFTLKPKAMLTGYPAS